METRLSNVAPARGLLNERVSMAHFDLIRVSPSKALTPFVENYWIILWDLTGKSSYMQENLPHPSPNMVIVPGGQSGLFGVQTGKWVYELKGSGRIAGTKFHPGALRAFYRQSISTLTDRHVPLNTILAAEDCDLEDRLRSVNDPLDIIADIERELLSCEPLLDDNAKDARRLVEEIGARPDITQPAQLAKIAGRSLRSLQRLFETYIGVGPKWVIDRYRMLAAVDALNRGETISLTALAHDLGYFDQAHFTNAFRTLTGRPPSAYLNLPPASS